MLIRFCKIDRPYSNSSIVLGEVIAIRMVGEVDTFPTENLSEENT